MLQYKKVVILDIEGNSARFANELKITQFSAIVFEKGKRKEYNFFNRNVNMIPPIVQRLTHLSISKLKQEGMSERRLIKNIYSVLNNADVIYAYGFEFDKRIIKIMFKKYNYFMNKMNWVDVQDIVKDRINPQHLKLSAVAKDLGFESKEFHNSLVDCKAILHIIEYLDAIEDNAEIQEVAV